MHNTKQIGNIFPTKTRQNPNQGRVYEPTGLCRCLNGTDYKGGGREVCIIEKYRSNRKSS